MAELNDNSDPRYGDLDLEMNKKARFDFKNLREGGVSWWTRILLRIAPLRGLMSLSRELGVDPELADKLHEVFTKVERIDLVPSRSGARGFHLVLNGSTCLYFNQDGDHFVYDGFETGKYDSGDVTIFDKHAR